MKMVYGYQQAKKLLDRSIAGSDYHVSPQLEASLKAMFGVHTPEEAVSSIIKGVKLNGDSALLEYSRLIDRVELGSLEVSGTDIEKVVDEVDGEIVRALQVAAGRIKSFHDAQRQAIPGIVETGGCYQISKPLKTAGIYAPGGTARYPSSVLMTAIPAKSAGVEQVILATPPGKDGKVPPLTLLAAKIAGVDRVFAMGGAQAIAALAYGTETVPAVDKICGPGNIFVMLAKKQVFGIVDIDGLQGPSEVMIVAGKESDAAGICDEILAQAEHDAMAQSILITTSQPLAIMVKQGLQARLENLSRSLIAGESVQATGLIVVVENMEQVVELVNLYAPEHLVIKSTKESPNYTSFHNAGCIFTGDDATVVLGDYVSGPSHALPTGGTARFSSPLNVAEFIRYYNVVDCSKDMFNQLGPLAATIARAEGLTAHAAVIENRMKESGSKQ